MDEKIKIGFHARNIIYYIANLYPPKKVIPEAVQNALDARAKNMLIKVDCKNRTIWILDDGDGASKEEIQCKFEIVGESLKSEDMEAIGTKGIGILAGIGIAEKYELVTYNKKDAKDMRRIYTLLKDEKQAGDSREKMLSVDLYPVQKIQMSGMNFSATTLVRLSEVNIRALSEISGIDSIERNLVDAYSAKLSGKNIKIIWIDQNGRETEKNVQNIKFRGTWMSPDIVNTKSGKVNFSLYLSAKPLDDPRILVTLKKGSFSIPLKSLIFRHQIDKASAEVFEKGHFEGNIYVDFCTPSASRDSLEYNNDLVVFSQVVKRQAEQLAAIIEQIEDTAKNSRFGQVSDELLKRYCKYFKDHPDMKPSDFRLLVGKKAGSDDNPPSSQIPLPGQEKKIVDDIIARRKKNPPAPDDGKKKETKPKSKVYHPRSGIRLEYVSPLPEEPQNWRSRKNSGMIQVNVLHPDCIKADNHGIRKLTEYVGLLCNKELTCALSSESEARVFSERFEDKFMELWQAVS